LNKHRKLIVSFDVSDCSGIVIGVSVIDLTSNGHCEPSKMVSGDCRFALRNDSVRVASGANAKQVPKRNLLK